MGDEQAGRLQTRFGLASALVCGVLALVSCNRTGPPVGPIAPTPVSRTVVSLEILCPTSLLVGQTGFCFAQAHYSDGSTRNPAPAAWSSSDPSVATIASLPAFGSISARGAGQVVISSKFEEGSATAVVSVRAEDFLTVDAAATQGLFQIGRTVTMTAFGSYGVASADSGQLNVEITDQDGNLIATGTPRTVSKGGDSFVMSSTFVIPSNATKVCRTAVLQIGELRLTAVGSASLFPCINLAQ